MLVNASGGHTPVRRFDNDGNSFWPQYLLYHVGNLGSKALLDLQSSGKSINDTR